ncbi:phage protease [Sphingobium ummariense]|uniref:Mu-like prophage I protein n=1 Tax=Sphingobium ummariense RL-3 TaxID=1346791 RepID=T0J5C3_9SPHN|nr:phage protease [Sphingobium ummariense]EQB32037.1 hypothetical protein M529_11885 [Sphingobium ummariense RL-3]
MKRGNQQHEIVAAAAAEVGLVDGAPARRVKLLPIGTIEMRDGRGPYLLRDRAHAEQVVAATRKWLGGADFNWDYNHQILQAGSEAPASGWTRKEELTVEEDGIYATVDWTEAATARIVAKEYRYISPLFAAKRGTGEVLYLKNSALTNVGAIDLPGLIAAGLSGEDDDMSYALIAAALGLAASATEQECVAAASTLKAKADATPATSAIAIAAGLAGDASVEDIAASVSTLKAAQVDPAKFVPVEQVAAVNSRLATLEGERAEREVAAAIEGGKLVPALKDWGLNLFKTNEQGWRDFIGAAPVVVAAGAALGGNGQGGGNADTLTAEEVAACAALGMSQEAFLAEKKAQTGAAA